MPPLPTKLRAPFWLFASALPLVLTAAGCPQLASDEFTKANIDADGGSGSDNPETDGSGGTHPVDISGAGGSGTTATTSQGGTDANPNGGTGATNGDADADADADTDTDTDTSSTSTEAVTTDGETTDTGTTDSGTTDDGTTDDGTTDSGTTDTGTTGDTLPDCTDELCDGLDNDCNEEIDEGTVCAGNYGCAGVALEFEGEDHGYMFCPRPATWAAATTHCEGHGMALVQIDSEGENEALATEADVQFAGDGGSGGNTGGANWTSSNSTRGGGGTDEPVFWTGGSDGPDQDDEGNWIWMGSGTPFWEGDADGTSVDDAYENWGDGRPNEANEDTPEDCAAVYFQENSDGAEIGTWNDLSCDYEYPFVCEAL